MKKYNKKGKKIDNLENEVKEQERELEAIKEAFQKNNLNALNSLPIKNLPKSGRFSAKAPKRLSEKEKERRDEIRRLKEVEDLNKIQQKLFKQVKGRRKIEPIDKKIFIANNKFLNINKDDIFAINLNKECDRILGNENSKQSIPNKTITAWRNRANINKIPSCKKHKKNNKISAYPLSAVDRRCKTKEKKKEKILNDEEKDENYLNTLNDELKTFYMEKTKEIFQLLKEIHLCRYIDSFLTEGYDIFEEFIKLPMDFFEKMEKPFLNKEQQKKLYDKLSIFKNKNNNNTNDKEEKIKMKIEEIIKAENKYSKTEIDFHKNSKNKTNNNNLKEKEIENGNNLINNNGIILNDTSPMIKKEELFYTDINELEKQRTEEFKKAVEEWRNNTNNNTSTVSNGETIDKTNKESNVPVKDSSLLVNSPNDFICCWNCFKPMKKEKSIEKDYDKRLDKSILFANKNFCCLKCIREYEKKKRTQLVCFECNKIFDFIQGFVAHEGQKFCSTNCKNKYIEIEKSIIKNSKQKNKKKHNMENKDIDDGIQNNNDKNNNEEYYEGDDYDPMDDF